MYSEMKVRYIVSSIHDFIERKIFEFQHIRLLDNYLAAFEIPIPSMPAPIRGNKMLNLQEDLSVAF